MKLEKITLLLMVLLFSLSACNSDDDGGENLLPQEEQNQLDDRAIVKFLEDHYFNDVGKAVSFDEEDTSDDDKTPLIDLAVEDEMGYWYVKNPNHEANGRQIQDVENDSILIQYELKTFTARSVDDTIYYSGVSNISNTINTTGYPIWDPRFYFTPEDDLTENLTKSYYEMEGIQDGLKHFNSSNKQATDLPAVNFQGLIIVPSRLVYERDVNGYGLIADQSVYLNFELYQVIDRD